MIFLYSLPFILQGLAMLFDEFYFHQKRGLPAWERIGHPLDTLSVLFCFYYLAIHPENLPDSLLYLGLASFSCLLITKDEFIHREKCNATETWLHSVLFVLHPVVLYLAYRSTEIPALHLPFLIQLSLATLMFFYQVIYWNWIAKEAAIDNSIYDELGDRWYTAYDNPVALLRQESKVKHPWVKERILKKFTDPSKPLILDVGCGAGFLANALSIDGFRVTGIDLSEESLIVARRFDTTKRVSYQSANAYALPFPDAHFDVVTCMDFLEHVDEPERAVREIARVLKPDGLFFFHTFNRNLLSHFVIIKLVEWLVANTPRHMHVIKLFIKPEELRRYCTNQQMLVQEMTGIKPIFSTIPFSAIFKRTVPESFTFELTPSLKLSYLGYAEKTLKVTIDPRR